jgi:hypothetical protein
MWRLFNQTLPFLPASKEFFEEVLWLADGQKAQNCVVIAPHSPAGHLDTNVSSGEADPDDETPAGECSQSTSVGVGVQTSNCFKLAICARAASPNDE